MSNDELVLEEFLKTELAATALQDPPAGWIWTTKNFLNASVNVVVIPTSGKLWISYTWDAPSAPQPTQVWLQSRKNGTQKPVNPGPNTFEVQALDLILYQLPISGAPTVRLTYRLT